MSTLSENWHRYFTAALTGLCANGQDPVKSMVKRAATVAFEAEKYVEETQIMRQQEPEPSNEEGPDQNS